MHRPPAVSHVVGRSRRHGLILLGLWLFALGTLICFGAFQTSLLSSGLLSATWLACGGFALRAWWLSPTGLLQWDGEQWYWRLGGAGGEALVCNLCAVQDWQRIVLVRLRTSESKVFWLWLEPGSSPGQWVAVRRALVNTNNEFTVPSRATDLEGLR